MVSLYDSLAQLYGAGSPKLAQGKVGARLAPPDPDGEVPAPDLAGEIDPAACAHAAAEVAASTQSLTEFPSQYPPVPLLSELSAASFVRMLQTVRVQRLPHGASLLRR